jgi:predicted metal-binding protein
LAEKFLAESVKVKHLEQLERSKFLILRGDRHSMIIKIDVHDLEISREYQCMCLKRSNSFRNGCPNYGRKAGCPPRKLFNEDYDLNKPVYLIATDFDLTQQTGRIRKMHPDWTEKAVYNPRYWQATARKVHEVEILEFLLINPSYRVERSPEGAGINVDNLCRNYGINLEWPPRKVARVVSIGAINFH